MHLLPARSVIGKEAEQSIELGTSLGGVKDYPASLVTIDLEVGILPPTPVVDPYIGIPTYPAAAWH